jgi:hypothetical protein
MSGKLPAHVTTNGGRGTVSGVMQASANVLAARGVNA